MTENRTMTMREKVARAIMVANRECEPVEWRGDEKPSSYEMAMADAAIAAMREPSDAMVDAFVARAIISIVRADALEEAAKVAESYREINRPVTSEVANRIARAIRSLGQD